MIRKLSFTLVLVIAALQLAHSQTIVHPWHVLDYGGGKSSAGGIYLHASIGQPAIGVMSAGSATLEGGYIPGIRFLGGTTSVLDLPCEIGWNLVSLPFVVGDPRKSILYPAGTSAAFAYLGSYQIKDTLANGAGYWIKFPSPASVHLSGTTIQKETVEVRNGWNLVGALSYPSLESDITPLDTTSFVSRFFGYKSSGGYYVEDTLQAGLGYWIKIRNPGAIVINTGSVVMEPLIALRKDKERRKETAGASGPLTSCTMTIRDAGGKVREIFLATRVPAAELSKWEMPPIAFEGMMDARFATNRMLEGDELARVKEVEITISAAEYPISLAWNVNGELKGAKLLVDGKESAISGTGETRIVSPESKISVKFAPSSGKELPKSFALHQNFPNPFNPTTTIRYDLPKQSKVRIVIYDALGREVREVFAGEQEAGFQSIEWGGVNARGNSVASGMYFYRIEAKPSGDGVHAAPAFTEVKKMLLVR